MNYLLKIPELKLLGVVFLLTLISCSKMKDLNSDSKLISDQDLVQDANEGGYLLPTMMQHVVTADGGIQVQQNLQADSYGGYLESPTPFGSNKNNMTYFMIGGWNDEAWTQSTSNVMDNWLIMNKRGIEKKFPDLYAIALIIKVFAGHRMVDTWGPYPYSGYGSAAQVKFDSEEEAYNSFFSDLDKAVTALKAAEAADPNADQIRFKKWDKSTYKGEYTIWIKVANTLRLRLAVRISEVSPAKAKTEAEKAVDPASGGVLSDIEGSFAVIPISGLNPYFMFANYWDDTRLAAPIETFLKGFGDKRLSFYALPATYPGAGGEVKGIRNGIAKPAKSTYLGYSKPNVQEATPIKQMDVAESYFLRAEGVLRGWDMGGTAKEFYEAGIKASFKSVGAPGADDYLQSTGVQISYVDLIDASHNMPSQTNVTVKWNEAGSFEEKLEQIITQKWIAMYPEGGEAWAEFRRTGYPKLYPVMVSNAPDLPLGTFIKRLTYPPAVIGASGAEVKAAIDQYLDGKDLPSTHIWWDNN